VIRSFHARIRNRNQPDIILEHLSHEHWEGVVLTNDGSPNDGIIDEVYVSPDAIPELIIQLQGILDFLSPIQNGWGGARRRRGGEPVGIERTP
jgi:hypothetical protein